jgi:hypothetical protein
MRKHSLRRNKKKILIIVTLILALAHFILPVLVKKGNNDQTFNISATGREGDKRTLKF